MTTRKLGLLGLMLGATLLGACDNTEPVVTPPPVVVNLLPAAVTLNATAPGNTVQLTAVVTNTTNQAVTFASSNTAVATVNATGLVTAVAQGVAVNTATSAQDPTAKGASTITVNPPSAPPTVSIKSITTGNLNTPVVPSNVTGQIDVTLNVTVPQGAAVQRVETLLDGNVVCSQAFSGTGSIVVEQDETDAADEIVCSIATDAFNATTGAPTFLNGPHTLTARLVQPSGNTISTPSTALVFNNTNKISIKLTPERTASDAAGLIWQGGTLGVQAIPTLFSGGNVASVTFSVNDNAAGGSSVGLVAITQAVTAAGPVTVTFPTSGTNNIAGFEDANTVVTVTTVIAGQAGPTATQTVRQDELGPTVVGTLTFPAGSNGWVGPNVTIASMTAGLTATDNGVNVVVKSVQSRPAVPANGTFVAVNAIGDLAETGTNTDLNFRGRACDALNNCTNAASQNGGVDKTPPTNVAYTPGSPAANSILAASGTFVLTGADGLSGPNDFLATLQRITSSGTACVVGASPSTGVCNRVSSLTNTFATGTIEGYYTFGGGSDSPDLVFRDQALNTTSIAGRTVVRDITAPAVQNIVLPGTLPSGGSATFTATATDNLDINTQVFRTIFNAAINGGAELPYAGPTTVGAFGAPLLTSSPLTATVNFIRSIEAAGPAPSGTVIPAVGARFDVSDFGGNTATAFNNFAVGTVPAGSSATGLGLGEWTGATSQATICDNTGANSCGSNPTSADLTGIAKGPSGTFNFPFARVIFYVNAAGVRTFIGETTGRSSTDTGNPLDLLGRVWTYGPVAFTGAGRGPAAPGSSVYTIEAVGVDASGDALFSQTFTVTVNKP